jgi:hypothetical protein
LACTIPPTRLNVATWVHEAMKEMNRVRTLKTEYGWYNKNKGKLELIGQEEGLILLLNTI